jgi:hypothetical protein
MIRRPVFMGFSAISVLIVVISYPNPAVFSASR